MNKFEKELHKVYKSKFCCFSGNGTTVMYLLFMALEKQNKKVLYPAISCTNPVNSCIYAGYTPEFCDVNLDDYTIDIKSMEDKLRTGQFGIVVPTHIYGHKYDRKKVKKICDKYGVFLIEDAAQTVDIGESDASIVSFGHTKIFETALGGGAIFLNDEVLYEKIKKLKSTLTKKPDNSKELFDEYREKYYSILKSNMTEKEKNDQLLELQLDSKKFFIYDMNYNEEILLALENKDTIEKNRIAKAKIYCKSLNKMYIKNPKVEYNFTPLWRYTFLVERNRKQILEKVRENKIDISSWYPSLSKIYKNQVLKNADYIEKHIVNLWIDESHNLDKIHRDVYVINEVLKESSYDK
ncbi:DegT/DnrJ/EryC1/StrS family aminotransferase [Clostridium botulinum]|uniref:DegT/DnrJ/EryC1/StrS family aminotransferase n=1 Tax=Clostridium botulinum TaxID=1491 RepID=UPI003DA5B64A